MAGTATPHGTSSERLGKVSAMRWQVFCRVKSVGGFFVGLFPESTAGITLHRDDGGAVGETRMRAKRP